ncbi:uncharacterized protein LOC128556688 [Mercenaria mercenaria]|uniref:uncharacterized protein LOC128556688 n=1 Tax=Mercenaria mercenaria TaxID=6596 RepID=UPI00234E5005|nr:uncharacterized protein LOC128556688 [Mercenaria mercenaria]
MNLQKLISTREGQRRLISIQLEKFNNELSQSEKTALLEIMEEKAEIIKNLNEKIVNHPDVEDLETELVDSDEYSIDLRLKLRKLKEDITKSSDTNNGSVIRDSQDFNGSARTVSDTASTAIAGFPLTNANYQKAIDLLQERFGQSHKIIDTYMQSLLDLPIPDNSVASLRRFHDKMENYIRGLESLGECQNSYGDLLVPIIMKKLPAELRRNLAREHGNARWQLQDLRPAIAREINILEVDQTDDNREPHVPTASLFTGTGKKKYITKNHPRTINSDNNKSKKLCLFCGDQHTSLNCEKVKTLDERLSIVKSKRLCYNCLGKHQVSDCRSKFRCRNCQRKHHSSICDQPSSVQGLNPSASPFVSSTSGPTGTPGTAIQLHSTTHQRSKVLLKTAVAQVSSQDDITTATNILLDEGAQRCFITEGLAEKLKLKHTGSDTISLACFGGKSEQCRYIPTGRVFLHVEQGEPYR